MLPTLSIVNRAKELVTGNVIVEAVMFIEHCWQEADCKDRVGGNFSTTVLEVALLKLYNG